MQQENLIQQIKNLGIEVIKVEKGEVKARCPKHDDSDPSFFFNLETQKFHCFAGCLKGKGIHQLIFQITGVSQAGVSQEEIVLKKFIANREADKKILPTIPMLPLALDNLGEEYLLKRGLTKETILKWQLRYWPDENAVVIPINTVGFVLRYLDKDAPKKYKYLAGTRISDTLFGIDKLPKTLTSIILVEGGFDAIYLHQLGFENTLALLHADISNQQIKLLKGISERVYIMLDGDSAGRVAAERVKKLLGSNFIVKICNLEEGKDPDNYKKEEIEKILKNAK